MNIAYLKNLGLTLSRPHAQVAQEMREDVGIPINNLAIDTGLSEQQVREILRSLRELGIANFGFLMSEDQGQLMGRGYWLEDFGSAVAYLSGVNHGLVKRRELALLSNSFVAARDILTNRYRTVALSQRRPLFLIWHRGLWCHGTIFTNEERLRGWELWDYVDVHHADAGVIELARSRVRQS